MGEGRLQAADGKDHDSSKPLSCSITSRCSHWNFHMSIFVPGFGCPIVFLIGPVTLIELLFVMV